MSPQETMLSLMTSLFQRTAEGTIRWTETAEEDSFRAVLSAGIVRVERYTDPRAVAGPGAVPVTTGLPFPLPPEAKAVGQDLYTLVVLDDKNRELGRLVPQREEHAMTLRNLWDAARRVARNADQHLQAILREIQSKAGNR